MLLFKICFSTSSCHDDQTSAWHIARQALIRVSENVGGKIVVTAGFMKHLETLMCSSDWQKRWSAVDAVKMMCCSVTSAKAIKTKTNLIDQTRKYLKDGHQRVRKTSLECIGQCSNIFRGDFQDQKGQLILPQLAKMLAVVI